MIKVEDINVFNIEGAISGMRFPMQSWAKSDSKIEPIDSEFRPGHFKYVIGPNDLALAQKLIGAGETHSKFMRQIMVSMNIIGPRFWWAEMDTYKIGTTSNSESTMHTLSKRPITKECFSFDKELDDLIMYDREPYGIDNVYHESVEALICDLETLRIRYINTQDNKYWRALIQLLPSSWNQMRHWTANYAVLRNIYTSRRNHKLTEWRTFCEEIEKLPYGKELITFGVNKNDTTA